MSGAGGGGANDTANQLALDTALQTMILAHARDVCRTRSTCGAAETQLPFPRPAEEKRDASWAIDHLGDPDPNDALATVIATADPTAYPSVRKLASSPGRTRVTALATLGAVRDEGAVDVLRTGLLADDVMARDASAWSPSSPRAHCSAQYAPRSGETTPAPGGDASIVHGSRTRTCRADLPP